MLVWSIEKKILELKYTWKISRNTSDRKINLFITVMDGVHKGIGEVAPNVRYNESPEQAMEQFHHFLQLQPEKIQSMEKLNECFEKIYLCQSLRFGIESAFVHYLCDAKKITVTQFLEIGSVNSVPVSYSIPMMDIGSMKSFYEENDLKRFIYIKIKTNAEEAVEAVK